MIADIIGTVVPPTSTPWLHTPKKQLVVKEFVEGFNPEEDTQEEHSLPTRWHCSDTLPTGPMPEQRHRVGRLRPACIIEVALVIVETSWRWP